MISKKQIKDLTEKLKTPKSKKIIYIIITVVIAFLFIHRFYAFFQEQNFDVFNIARNNLEKGTPVNVLYMEKNNGVLYEPLTIKNNTAYISGARVNIFRSGQKSGNCKIVSVSKNIDLDTGMHVIKTQSCKDGLQYIEKEKIGLYIPMSAISGNTIYVVNNGVAEKRQIEILDQDAQNALIKSGIQEGDIVILSNVKNNEKIRVME